MVRNAAGGSARYISSGLTVGEDRGKSGETAEDENENDDHHCEPSRIWLKWRSVWEAITGNPLKTHRILNMIHQRKHMVVAKNAHVEPEIGHANHTPSDEPSGGDKLDEPLERLQRGCPQPKIRERTEARGDSDTHVGHSPRIDPQQDSWRETIKCETVESSAREESAAVPRGERGGEDDGVDDRREDFGASSVERDDKGRSGGTRVGGE